MPPDTSAVRILTDLRNALAHGGIAYLDEKGHQTDSQAAMLAFVGAVMKKGRITGVNVLRVHERHYREFLAALGLMASPSRHHSCADRAGSIVEPRELEPATLTGT